ncbi:MAG TPA: MarR family transcriptional regulator [Kofleriaceae bacterium]|nr:MarR family transcriptional regulator [Kofleriaceae bacterium]
MASSRNVPHILNLWRRVASRATEESMGMNLKQVTMLANLRDKGELPQTTLCDMMKLTQNTVVTWLNELEDAGYVARIRDPEDRRKHNVALTDKGAGALERAETELRRMEDEALSGLTADERTQLRKLMAKALEAVD